MPRDGSNVYNIPPGTEGVPDTVIESAKYNAFITDVEQDLNQPRPILAGGSGATNADQALQNLSGEKSKQGPVTNYSSFPFVNGSFYSNAGATSAPDPTNGFAGTYYEMSDTNYAAIEARDMATGILYLRNKVAGVWGAWVTQAGSINSLDGTYVNVTGDTMTGALNVLGNIASATTPTTGTYYFGNSGTRYLAYDGTNFTLSAGSGGLFTSGPISCQGANALTAGSPNLSFSLRLLNSTSGLYKNFRVSTAGDLEIVNNANTAVVASLSDIGALSTANNITAGTDLRATSTCYSSGAFGFNIDTTVGLGTVGTPYVCNVMSADPNFGTVTMETVHISGVWAGWQFTVTPNVFQFRNDGNAHKSAGGATWVIISDERIKTVKSRFTAGLDAVTALRPVRFTYKGNHSFLSPTTDQTPADNKSLETEYIGLVAQEGEKALPECFTRGVGFIDGKKTEDIRSAEYTPLIFALVNAVKELKARVEELEAR